MCFFFYTHADIDVQVTENKHMGGGGGGGGEGTKQNKTIVHLNIKWRGGGVQKKEKKEERT